MSDDTQRWAELDQDRCQCCWAQGPDMRSLLIECGYEISEVVPEFISLAKIENAPVNRGYYMRICKTCRARLLGILNHWFASGEALRDVPKDSDGVPENPDPNANIPVRINGAVVMLNAEEYAEFRARKGLQ
jgi:hypothetical protein